MKKLALSIAVVIITVFSSCTDNENNTELLKEALSEEEITNLEFLREEEKLARDVYSFSFEKYGEIIFNNISQSEQQHMDQVLKLLNTYQISDPASTEIGVFNNAELQNLYDNLTAKSALSLADALIVGATIEDLDIKDIADYELITNKLDILSVLGGLKCGSRNHLRNYANQLEIINVNYVPQYISLEEYNEIINSSNEKCGR
jgi:hypothetical protein